MSDTLNIGGKDRPIKFGWSALKQFEKLTGKGLSALSDVSALSLDDIEKLIYAGLITGAKAEGVEVDFKIDDLETWLDAEGFDVFNRAMGIFGEQSSPPEKNA